MQLIPLQTFIIQICFFRFLWFFRLKCWFKGQIISRTHLRLPNVCKLMCFDRNINGNRDVKFLIWIIGHCTDQRNLLYASALKQVGTVFACLSFLSWLLTFSCYISKNWYTRKHKLKKHYFRNSLFRPNLHSFCHPFCVC